MPFLYKFSLGNEKGKVGLLGEGEVGAVTYHALFDYPLTAPEVIKWSIGKQKLSKSFETAEITEKDGYYFIAGKEGLIYQRVLKERISAKKIEIAKDAASVLKHLLSVKGVFLTGALSMENASFNSDIDLMIVTKRNLLWTTRLITYLVLRIMNYAIRKPKDKEGKDQLCLNMWLDESALSWDWRNRNLYTAHEIAQVKPLVNKDFVYEEFIGKNKWVRDYWPNAVRVQSTERKVQRRKILSTKYCVLCTWLEKLAFKFQYAYMKSRITREIITPHKAIFHPSDWGKIVLQRLSS